MNFYRKYAFLLFATLNISLSAAPPIYAWGENMTVGENIAVFRPDGGLWIIDDLNDGWKNEQPLQFGLKGDRPVVGDFEGDGRDEIVVYRNFGHLGYWYIDKQNDGYQGQNESEVYPLQFGLASDIPLMGRIKGISGTTDNMVVFRPNTGEWFIDRGNNGFQPSEDGKPYTSSGFTFDPSTSIKAFLADIDGDGWDEPIVFSNGVWNILDENFNLIYRFYHWERNTDTPVVGDIDNDGEAEVGVFRAEPGNVQWRFINIENGTPQINNRILVFNRFSHGDANEKFPNDPAQNELKISFGLPGDVPIVGRFGGSPRGLSCLHCSHPNAGRSADSIADAIAESGIINPSINFLCDDTFGCNGERIYSILDRISGKARHPHVEFYLLNGPQQRRFGQRTNGYATNYTPAEFNKRIENPISWENEVKGKITDHFYRVVLICRDIVTKKTGTCYISPMLEDNMSSSAFRKVAEHIDSLVNLHLGDIRSRVIKVRNSVHADAFVPSGWINERHPTKRSSIRTHDRIVTTDAGAKGFPNYSSQRTIALAASRNGRLDPGNPIGHNLAKYYNGGPFIAWLGKLQGLNKNSNSLPNPDARHFGVVDATLKNEAIRLLRGGARTQP